MRRRVYPPPKISTAADIHRQISTAADIHRRKYPPPQISTVEYIHRRKYPPPLILYPPPNIHRRRPTAADPPPHIHRDTRSHRAAFSPFLLLPETPHRYRGLGCELNENPTPEGFSGKKICSCYLGCFSSLERPVPSSLAEIGSKWGPSCADDVPVRGARARACPSYRSTISTIGTPFWPDWDQEGSRTQEKPSRTTLNMVLCAG